MKAEDVIRGATNIRDEESRLQFLWGLPLPVKREIAESLDVDFPSDESVKEHGCLFAINKIADILDTPTLHFGFRSTIEVQRLSPDEFTYEFRLEIMETRTKSSTIEKQGNSFGTAKEAQDAARLHLEQLVMENVISKILPVEGDPNAE